MEDFGRLEPRSPNLVLMGVLLGIKDSTARGFRGLCHKSLRDSPSLCVRHKSSFVNLSGQSQDIVVTVTANVSRSQGSVLAVFGKCASPTSNFLSLGILLLGQHCVVSMCQIMFT